jgi:hypothetical protein
MQWKLSLISALVAFAMGWQVNGWRLNSELATTQEEYAAQTAELNSKVIAAQDQATQVGNQLSDALMKSQRKAQNGTNLLVKKIDDAEKAKPSTCHFDADFVRMYNAANTLGADEDN